MENEPGINLSIKSKVDYTDSLNDYIMGIFAQSRFMEVIPKFILKVEPAWKVLFKRIFNWNYKTPQDVDFSKRQVIDKAMVKSGIMVHAEKNNRKVSEVIYYNDDNKIGFFILYDDSKEYDRVELNYG